MSNVIELLTDFQLILKRFYDERFIDKEDLIKHIETKIADLVN